MDAFTHTVQSFVELVKYVLQIPGVKFFLSEKISQDPLENFFGCQRQRGRTGENPNASQFCKNTQALRIINSVCDNIPKGNCRGRQLQIDMQDTKPLPKRRRINRKKTAAKKKDTKLLPKCHRNRKETLAKENDAQGGSLFHPESVDSPLVQSMDIVSSPEHAVDVDHVTLAIISSPAQSLDKDSFATRPLDVNHAPVSLLASCYFFSRESVRC